MRIPNPRNPIELCDRYTTKRELIHVKKYGQSSTLSHLFAQGLNSGALFMKDNGFRKAANKKLPTSHKLADPAQPLAKHTVTYGIISGKTAPLNIPFFSKVTLHNAVTTLTSIGYKVTITKIQAT